jgi:PHD/YefM family antitoxin component YafN of YafNO toxin-antitoxin module
MRVVSESDAMQSLPSLLKEVKTHAVVISDGKEELAALVSMEDYELVRKAKVERLFRAMDEFGEQVRVRAAAEGLTPDDVMKILDRKAS